MSDTGAIPPPQTPNSLGEARIMAIVCYVLFIVAVTNGLTGIVGVVLAYIKRTDARGTIWESHFNNLIYVFWSGVVVFAVFLAAVIFGAIRFGDSVQTNAFPAVLFFVPVIWVLSIAYIVWYLYRTVKGVVRALDNKAYG
jgi:uncharacterized membrane protein